MGAPEPPSMHLCYIVTRGEDIGRIGQAVDVMRMDEVFPNTWKDWFLSAMRLRPRRRWSAVWVVLEFAEGDRGAYRLDELEQRHV